MEFIWNLEFENWDLYNFIPVKKEGLALSEFSK